MEKQLKTHPMEIPKEIIAWFFTEAEKHLLEVYLVKVVGMDILLVDVVYEPKQRMEMMRLIERVDDYNHAEEERRNQEEES
ncbi:MAG TPA: hypothetical protein PK637_17645 [Flavobacteriales bacterium]|nr:hypothetical protein [Flavobacteriales bacterium]HRJ39355.1 hypothetical protein [Flavobacteriales bacterium]